jgi:hypothetical protein
MPSQERQTPPREPVLLKTGSERLAKGEAVSGGLSKPMTRKDLLKAAAISESFMRRCERYIR